MAQEFKAIRRRFDEDDWTREMQWGSTHAATVADTADWEHLFHAIRARLGQVVDDLAGAGLHSGLNGHAAPARTVLIESVTALDQLHAMLALEFGRRSGLEALDQRLRLARAMKPATPVRRPALALLYVDLDDFRSIDGAHGHATGDEVLAIIAIRVSGVVRVQDTVRHLGGDALACLLDDWSDREQLLHLVGKLADAVSAPVTIGDREVTVRPTIGIATSAVDGESAEVLLHRADAAMSRAKRQRASYAFFDGRTDG